jgi:dTDP-4-dehydrorhamnose 3,5-epimerase-like enzyme
MDAMLAELRPLTAHLDERGKLTEIFRASDDAHGFGQAYITTCAAGVVKAWHRHKLQVDRWYCVAGAAKVGIWDAEAKRGQTIILSADTPQLLIIPAGLFHGFTPCHGHREAAILNLPSREYDPADADEERRGPLAFPFRWAVESR